MTSDNLAVKEVLRLNRLKKEQNTYIKVLEDQVRTLKESTQVLSAKNDTLVASNKLSVDTLNAVISDIRAKLRHATDREYEYFELHRQALNREDAGIAMLKRVKGTLKRIQDDPAQASRLAKEALEDL